jgi:hypothetical protein
MAIHSTVSKKVVISHFKNFMPKYSQESIEYTLLDAVISLIEANIHPCSSIADNHISYFKEITGIDLHLLCIEGIENNTSPSFTEVTPTHDTACKNFSCAENISDNYRYANIVPVPTCSHPKNESTIYCGFISKMNVCPLYEPDTKKYTEIKVLDSVYTVNFSRTKNGNILFDIFDQENNLVNQLSFYADVYNSLDKEDIILDLQKTVETVHQNISTVPSQSVSIPVELQQKPKGSYILSLVSND